ncbi:uncharacterized protein LOC108833444 [Raphanus sativus]|uniref:Uncharacterized protein LOC108833444 n=1 Tax=Raphanus sativus TaxID=3726 RepID=A0A9W3DGV9_RAPSA|nr:uncharacterized protein LOC108833444 [Raphanus sativus]
MVILIIRNIYHVFLSRVCSGTPGGLPSLFLLLTYGFVYYRVIIVCSCFDLKVYPSDVMGSSVPGPIVLLVDCPTESLDNCYQLSLCWTPKKNMEFPILKACSRIADDEEELAKYPLTTESTMKMTGILVLVQMMKMRSNSFLRNYCVLQTKP